MPPGRGGGKALPMDTPGFAIRRATAADHPALRQTIRALNVCEEQISRDRDESEAAAAACLDALLRRLAGGGAAFVADTGGEVIGHLFCVVEDAPPFLRAPFRRQAVIADAFVVEPGAGGACSAPCWPRPTPMPAPPAAAAC